MVAILSALVSIFAFRFRGRASLEIELIALRHQVTVLRRQRPGRLQLSFLDRLLWVWLYRIWPQVIDAMVLVKPATVVQWHRTGFRLHWRWRSRRPGRPKTEIEIRDLIRRMSRANLVGCAPHPRGTTQARYRDQPSHSWALDAVASQGPLPDLADLPAQPPARPCGDRHVCGCHRDASAPLHLDCAQPRPQMGCSFRGHPKSHAKLALAPDDRGLSLGHSTALSAPRPGHTVWSGLPPSRSRDGNHGGHHCAAITLAKSLRRASHQFDPP